MAEPKDKGATPKVVSNLEDGFRRQISANSAKSGKPASTPRSFLAQPLEGGDRPFDARSNASSEHSLAKSRPSFKAYAKDIGMTLPVPAPLDEVSDQGEKKEGEKKDGRKEFILHAISLSLMVAFAYWALLFFFQLKLLLPYDGVFALFVIWLGSIIGGNAAKLVGIPELLGMLCAGILLKNCGDLARGLPSEWGAKIRAFGLMNILMRGGLEMDFGAVRRLGMTCVRLTVLPGVCEALTAAGLGVAIFNMPFFLALAMGFILGAVSPAVVVGGMFALQAHGYGVAQGIPSLVIAAASFDDVVAISGFSMFIGLATGKGDPVTNALHGPLEIALGLVAGMLGGLIMAATTLWEKGWKRSLLLLIIGVGFTFTAKYLHFSGAGALASLVMAGAAGRFWEQGVGGRLSLGKEPDFVHEAEHDLCTVWKFLAQPLLFGVIGSALDFGKVEAATIPKALAVICGGILMRTFFAFVATCGAGLAMKERVFIALAWMPKATVQAALASVPLDLVRTTLNRDDDPAKFDKLEQHGIDIISVAVFSILVSAPAGLVVIQRLGPRWLQQDDIVQGIKLVPEEDNGLSDKHKMPVFAHLDEAAIVVTDVDCDNKEFA